MPNQQQLAAGRPANDPGRPICPRSIRAQRALAGLLQQDVADALGVGRQVVSRWETGARLPTRAQLRELALVLRCREGDFAPRGR